MHVNMFFHVLRVYIFKCVFMFLSTCSSVLEYVFFLSSCLCSRVRVHVLEYVFMFTRVRVHVYSSTFNVLEYVQCSRIRVHVIEYVFMFTRVRVHVYSSTCSCLLEYVQCSRVRVHVIEYVLLICYLLKAGLGIIQHNTRLLDTFRR